MGSAVSRKGRLALAVALGLLVAVQLLYFTRGVIPGDALVYLAAGERLNAGHQLYALVPGDRPVEIKPPFWTVPLLSPPPIAVVFRAFAVFPGDVGAYVWWVFQLLALGATLVMLGRRRPMLLAGAMIVLLIPTVYEIGVGNLNSTLLLGLVLTWRWATRGRETPAGAVAAVMTAVKLTPAAAVWWLLVTGHRRAVLAAAVTGRVVLAVSIAGAGLDPHLQYLGFLGSSGAIGKSPLSLAGMAIFLGVPDGIANLLPTLAIAVGLTAIVLLRRRPGLAFAAVVLTMIYGSPAVSINWYVLLYALLAPLAWPVDGTASASPGVAPVRTRIWPSASA